MTHFPRERTLDSTWRFLSEGYEFISRRCRRFGTDAFETRLMLRKVVCMRGAEAARMFYADDRFTREGALPPTTLRLLQDRGSTLMLEGAEHRHRKAMFLSLLLDEEHVNRLRRVAIAEWMNCIPRWEESGRIVLFEEANAVLAKGALRWAGVPFDESDVPRLLREITAMIEKAARFGPSNWRALLLRRRHERFIRRLIGRIRAGTVRLPDDAPARIIAEHRDLQGHLLGAGVAAVELINIVRPVVAVSRFIVFAAMALHAYPRWRDKFASGDDAHLEHFAEEVRRFYPFFPAVGGRVRKVFEWRGRRFEPGEWALLDLYGTNRDTATFEDPDSFWPERGCSWREQSFGFVPQGAGVAAETHRCPGERITVELMMDAVRILTRSVAYDVPEQDLSLPASRIPALPRSGFLMKGIRRMAPRSLVGLSPGRSAC